MKNIIEKIYDYSLEEIMGQRFGSYSKYIIQDRAIPDVRDGLKPVQRRIIFSMYKEKNTFDKGYRKSAKTVGDVIGNYHPHGDTSIYDAMVRMSQDWKIRLPYIDMHGNNGSIDGDSPAAYRYTEARLSKISNELIKDIDRDTVLFSPNFDDTILEPTVLPAKYPNLLVNGATGISAGYATNIPPHNLGEAIDATIKRIDSPNCTLDTLMGIVKGPDFPTGGIVEGIDGIRKAYETGRGKIIVKSRVEFETTKTKTSIIATEIPYEVNKAALVKKIDEIRLDKKIDGIIEVRDESDRDGLRISIDLKKEANKEVILNYLLKNTDLQISYNFNMIGIVNRAPKQLSLILILDSYIEHLKEVILKRTTYDLEHAKARLHIVEGLIKCLSILDEVIKTIRASKNKSDAKDNLVKEYDFTELQAEAIVTLQLYRLTNTDVTLLEEELKNLNIMVTGLQGILNDENVLKSVMKDELRKIKREYALPRITTIEEEITELKIETTDMIVKEDVVVMVTKDGYIKRSSLRSYQATKEESQLKDNDYALGIFELNTVDVVLLFTSLGNYLYLPVFEIPNLVWKDLGKHVSNIIKLDQDEKIVSVVPVTNFDEDQEILIASKQGMIKKVSLNAFKSIRYSRPITCINLKDKDELIEAFLLTKSEVFVATYNGYGLWFKASEISSLGIRAAGVKAINLKADYVVSVTDFDLTCEHISIITENGTAKRVKISDFEISSRAKRGLLILRTVKSNPYFILKTFIVPSKEAIGLKNGDITYVKTTDFPISDRYSTGTQISKEKLKDAFIKVEVLTRKELLEVEEVEAVEEKPKKEKVSLKEIDDRLLTIEDFLNSD